MRWLDSITNAMNMNLGKLWKMVRVREAWRATVYGVTKSQTGLNNNNKHFKHAVFTARLVIPLYCRNIRKYRSAEKIKK